jgi:hypothetical protein
MVEVWGRPAPASTGGLPAGVPGEAKLGTVADVSPAGLGRGDGSPAGKPELNPAGLGSGEGRPAGFGPPGATAGAGGWAAGRTDRFAVCAGAETAAASSSSDKPRRVAGWIVHIVFMSSLHEARGGWWRRLYTILQAAPAPSARETRQLL